MVTNLIERLRRLGPRTLTPEIGPEAADEIERLLMVCKDKTELLMDAYAKIELLSSSQSKG